MVSEGMSGRRYREEKARLEAEQAQLPPPQEITMSRKTAFQVGIWAAVGATVWFAIVLPLILFVLFGVFGLSLF